MKSQTRIVALLLSFLLCFSVFGCGKEEKDTNVDDKNETQNEVVEDENLPYVECSGAKVTLTTDSDFLREDGEAQLIHYTQEEGVWTGLKFIYSDEYEWNSLNDPEFYVYNPTEYDYTLDIFCTMDTSPHTFQDMKSVCTHTATAKEWTKIEVTAEAIATTSNNGTYPFLGISVKDEENGGNHSAQWAAMELYFDGFGFLLSDPETTYDFINADMISIGGAILEVSDQAEYSKDITGKSLKYTKKGTTTAFKFKDSADIDWSKPETLTFWVYNPTQYDYIFNLALAKDEEKVFTDTMKLGAPLEAVANGWTRFEVYGEDLKRVSEEGYSTLYISVAHTSNGENGSAQWDAIELYFSGFSFLYQ